MLRWQGTLNFQDQQTWNPFNSGCVTRKWLYQCKHCGITLVFSVLRAAWGNMEKQEMMKWKWKLETKKEMETQHLSCCSHSKAVVFPS